MKPTPILGDRTLARVCAVLTLIVLTTSPTILWAALDNNVEWNGVSHLDIQDRRPICPVNGESFEVRFQAYKLDIGSARIQVDDGSVAWINASPIGDRGPYTVWSATVPATASSTLSYFIELTDDTDVDYYSVTGAQDNTPTDGGFVLDFNTLSHAPKGATLVSDGAVFKVWSPSTTSARVSGEFNGWGAANPMTRDGEYWVAHVQGTVLPRQQYKYVFNGNIWKGDPRARAINPTDNLNSYIEDPLGYQWQVTNFETPPRDEMVIYQLHLGTFAGRNDPFGGTGHPAGYPELTARVSQLVDLGINAVMLNPITEFPGDLSAGYNPISMYAPEWKYGTPDELKEMVDTLHANGIAVILDIVWNHFSSTDNYLWNYDGTQIYFDSPAVETPWGSQADFDNPEVRSFFLDSVSTWFDEYRLDGFRADGTDFMNMPPHDASGWSLMQAMNDMVDNRWIDKVIIAEQLPDDSFVTKPTSASGAGFDAQYLDAFTDRLREEIFDSAFGDPDMFQLQQIVNGFGPDLAKSRVVNYVELHDEAWPTSGGQRIVKTIDGTFPHDDEFAQGRSKLAQGFVMTAPGIPAMLQGTEWLEDTDFGTDFSNRIDWSKKITYADIFQYYQDMISLRTSNAALRADAPHQVFHVNDPGNVIAWQRYQTNGDVFVVIANFSGTDYTNYRIGLPQSGNWFENINSQSVEYGGSGFDNPGTFAADNIPAHGYSWSKEIQLPQMGLVILQRGSEPTTVEPEVRPTVLRLAPAIPNPSTGSTLISFTLPTAAYVELNLYDVRGRRVTSLVEGNRDAGRHDVPLTTPDLSSGIYFYRLDTGGRSLVRKLVIVD